MNIETKFKTRQIVYLLFTDKVWKVEIESIRINIDDYDDINTTYTIKENPAGTNHYTRVFPESQLFATKELLLNSL